MGNTKTMILNSKSDANRLVDWLIKYRVWGVVDKTTTGEYGVKYKANDEDRFYFVYKKYLEQA